MVFRSACIFTWAMLAVAANGAECRLDHASYIEPASGATIQFHPKTSDDAALTVGLFELALPNVSARFAGEIAWNAGSNTRPDGSIGDWWTDTVYAVDKGSVGLVGDADMTAPRTILLTDFGRALYGFEPFAQANPEAGSFDLFTLVGCSP
jgi:hypothetical protein